MAFTFKELKQLKNDIAAAMGIDSSIAARVIGYYNGGGPSVRPDVVRAMMGGDLSHVGPALVALGYDLPAADNGSRESKTGESITASGDPVHTSGAGPVLDDLQGDNITAGPDDLEHVQGESVNPHELPPGLYDDIAALIENYCRQQNISEPTKMHPLQWQGVCYRVGESIKARGILRDRERERTRGGVIYDGEKLVALLALYGVICADYKQVAFTFNFQRFSGVSREYFNDYCNRGLSSSRVGIVEKAQELQRASLVGAVTGGGSATVGNIFLSKALAGLQETSTVVHVSASPSVGLSDLPRLGGIGGDLPKLGS